MGSRCFAGRPFLPAFAWRLALTMLPSLAGVRWMSWVIMVLFVGGRCGRSSCAPQRGSTGPQGAGLRPGSGQQNAGIVADVLVSGGIHRLRGFQKGDPFASSSRRTCRGLRFCCDFGGSASQVVADPTRVLVEVEAQKRSFEETDGRCKAKDIGFRPLVLEAHGCVGWPRFQAGLSWLVVLCTPVSLLGLCRSANFRFASQPERQ